MLALSTGLEKILIKILLQGALNLYSQEELYNFFLKTRIVPLGTQRRVIIVFHCEFSSERGPRMWVSTQGSVGDGNWSWVGTYRQGIFPDQFRQNECMHALHYSLENVREVEERGFYNSKVWSNERKSWELGTNRGKGNEWCYLDLVLRKEWALKVFTGVIDSLFVLSFPGIWPMESSPCFFSPICVFSKGVAVWENRTGPWTSILHCTIQSCISSMGATETSFQNIR